MAKTLSEKDWNTLLERIKAGKCTPFLGAGVNFGVLPIGAEIARKWAEDFGYPLEDSADLARVAQFLAIERDDKMVPKELILQSFSKFSPPDFSVPNEPLSALAALPLPIYMTTNYDDFMVRALKRANKDPKRELCCWNSYLKEYPSVFKSATGFQPTPANPVVFHLHGHDEKVESLVLTEDDYLDFLVSISRQPDLLPPRIQESLTGASLLFIGYRLADWDFRVIFRGLVTNMESSLRRRSVAVLQVPQANDLNQQKAQKVLEYLTNYFEDIKVALYCGTAAEFTAELKERWGRFSS